MKMRPKRHQFVGMITIDTGLLALAYICRFMWATSYSQSGKSYVWRDIADVIEILGEIGLIIISLFIGQGYLISYPMI